MSSSKKDLKIYNSLTSKKEVFKTINDKMVGMYVCGPTVYNTVHLGNCRTFISFDLIFRYLKHIGYKVRYVRNITDVGHLEDDSQEDKISKRAAIEKLEPMEIVQKYTNDFRNILQKFNLLPPNIEPTATGHIIEQIQMIKKIIENGFAYEKNGSVYFDLKQFNKKYKYGSLSNRNLEELINESRELKGSEEKKNPQDFALWKKAGKKHIMKWQSPWGDGFPGWHIECSAMGHKYLGEKFDIHGGGIDLKFPHHDCEIAQSEAICKKNPAKYWLHSNMLTLNGKKMSKSIDNFILPSEIFNGENDFFDKPFSPNVLKFFMFQAHYRNVLDISNDSLLASEKGYKKLIKGFNLIESLKTNQKKSDFNVDQWISNCYENMNDDFNTPMLISELFECIKFINSVNIGSQNLNINDKNKISKTFKTFLFDILALKEEKNKSDLNKPNQLIELLLKIRNQARLNKNYEMSDQIRDELEKIGIKINDEGDNSKHTLI